MKTFIIAIILMMVLLVVTSLCSRANAMDGPAIEASAQGCVEISGSVSVEATVDTPTEEQKAISSPTTGGIVPGTACFYDVLARLTPTKKDNSIVSFIAMLYNAIVHNLQKGGGIL